MEPYAWAGFNFILFTVGFAILAATILVSYNELVGIQHKRWKNKRERKQLRDRPHDEEEEED